MKAMITGLCAFALIGLVGCDSGTPGGPGAKKPADKTPARADNTFKLDVPALAISMKQGETKTTSISLKRMHNFDEDVRIKFGPSPKGVTFDPAAPVIKHGEEEAKITVTAADDAALGDFNVQVTGTPTNGAEATNTIKISIAKK